MDYSPKVTYRQDLLLRPFLSDTVFSYNSFKSPVEIEEPGHDRISFQYNAALTRSHMYYGAELSWKGLRYFGVGAASGALGAGVGTGVSSLLGGGSFGADFIGSSAAMSVGSGFLSGAIIGVASGTAGGAVSGFGNALIGGESFGNALKRGLTYGAYGAISCGALGGVIGGIDAAIDGREFWTGRGESRHYTALSDNGTLNNDQYSSTSEMRTDYNSNIGS